MRSKKVYLPIRHSEGTQRLTHDALNYALDYGLFDLPTLNDLQIPLDDNTAQSVPLKRMKDLRLCFYAKDTYLLFCKTSLFKKLLPSDMLLTDQVVLNLGAELPQLAFLSKAFASLSCSLYIENYNKISNLMRANLPDNASVFFYGLKVYILQKLSDNIKYAHRYNDITKPLDKYLFNKDQQLQCDYLALLVKLDDNPLLRDLHKMENKPLDVAESLLEYDNRRMQLPILNKNYLDDPKLGLWDAYWPEGMQADPKWYVAVELDRECEASDPWLKVQNDCPVCIDFGTSSTVAAVRERNGNIRLLRIGGNWTAQATDSEYENPTALEFSNYHRLMEAWSKEPWRPLIEWKDVKCSHQAKNELSDKNKSFLAACGIRNIKTWARNLPGQPPLHLRDEQGAKFELEPQPVEQQLDGIGEFDTRSLDPIELYTFFLGLSLNNQSVFGGRIYCNYYLTFPVKFPQEVRQRILQGFYRGLLRSLPLSLVSSPRWQEDCPFTLKAEASEPTAFAAGVLPYLGIEPTENGVAFGVFDFGGGTTDFAFGLYRTATVEENGNKGWEQVLDILDVSGDENLGGEHLLDLLAYEVIKAKSSNAEADKRIPAGITVLCPQNMQPFAGSEFLFADSQEAQANTVILREALRSLWEEGKLSDDDTGVLNLSMKDQDGKDVNVQFTVDEDALKDCLKQRIREGVVAFFTTFQQAFYLNNLSPDELHVLLAGNSCRSPLVQEVFQNLIVTEVVPNAPQSVIVHYEMIDHSVNPDNSDDNPEQKEKPEQKTDSLIPTLKTGVAIGLLSLLPGEATGIVERNSNKDAESPFLFSVGTFKKNILKPVLQRNTHYGEWHFLGKVYENGVTLFGYSDSPLAGEEKIARGQCLEKKINWGKDNFGKSIYIKATSPYEITLALSQDDSEEQLPDESTAKTYTLQG